MSQDESDNDSGDDSQDRRKQIKEIAENSILEAERFKAEIAQSKGMEPTQSVANNPNMGKVMDDDQFVQVSSHVDNSVIARVQRGEFVELEKLLLKQKRLQEEDVGYEVTRKEGKPFLAPTQDKETKINGIRKWEQAFRVYAAIYSKANPDRAAEIWQYVENINRAATTYKWDNVAAYDYQFRQWMGRNPARNWGKTFGELWNLCLLAPVSGKVPSHVGNPHNESQKKGYTYCWKFNKGHCSYGPKCRFEHRCSYCNSKSHGSSRCQRKNGKRDSREGDSIPSRKDKKRDKDRDKDKETAMDE